MTNTPILTTPISPNSAAPNPLWPPDQKFLAAGAGGLLTWALITALHFWNITLDPMLAQSLPWVFSLLLYYLVPAANRDVVKRVTDDIVTLANADQSNPTQAKLVDLAESNAETLKNIQAGLIQPVAAHMAVVMMAQDQAAAAAVSAKNDVLKGTDLNAKS